MRHIGVRDVRELRDLRRDERVRLDEGVEALDDLPAAQARGSDLDELVLPVGKTRRLGVEHHHIVFYQAKRTSLRTDGERRIRIDDLLRGAREHRLRHHQGGEAGTDALIDQLA